MVSFSRNSAPPYSDCVAIACYAGFWLFVTEICAAPPARSGRLIPPGVLPATHASQTATILVRVNGEPVTREELQRHERLLRLTPDQRPQVQQARLEAVIDARLLRQFLRTRKIVAAPREIDDARGRLNALRMPRAAALPFPAESTPASTPPPGSASSSGSQSPPGSDSAPTSQSSAQPMKSLGAETLDESALRELLAAHLGWQKYLDLVVTHERLNATFQRDRAEFDGTELRVSQIFLPLESTATPAEVRAITSRLLRLREEIVAGRISFAAAAKQYSTSPSAAAGGDLGLIRSGGELPAAVNAAVFRLQTGAISEPIRTSFGLHLCTVTERRAGTLSLEDALPLVQRRVAEEIRAQTVADLRRVAKIEYSAPPAPSLGTPAGKNSAHGKHAP